MPSAESTPASVHEPDPVRPTKDDEVAAAGSELIGGPSGGVPCSGRPGGLPSGSSRSWRSACSPSAWSRRRPATTAPGSSAPARSTRTRATRTSRTSTQGRGFADGLVPYFDKLPGDMDYLEYPVLTGVFMEVAAWLTPGSGSIQAPGTVVLDGQRRDADGVRGGHRRLRDPHARPPPLGRPAGRPGARLRADRHHQLGPAGGRSDGRGDADVVAGPLRSPSASCWGSPRPPSSIPSCCSARCSCCAGARASGGTSGRPWEARSSPGWS